MNDTARRTRTTTALRAAQLYYLQGATMEAIAQELRVSRSSVSRLLAFARESGLVTITVNSPREARTQLEERLAARFGVTAHVVSTPARSSDLEALERTARVAAGVLAAGVRADLTIGIAWGATLSAVVRHLPRKPADNVHAVQMNGSMNLHTAGLSYAGELLDGFGSAFQASLHQFPVPAFFDDPATKHAMWRERSVRSVLDVQSRVELFVFGLGAPRSEMPSHVYSGGYLDERDLAEIDSAGIVGDCATHFYRLDGSDDGVGLNERSSGPSLEATRRIPHRLCVASGASKRDSLAGAFAAGLITELVVDEALARAVLAG